MTLHHADCSRLVLAAQSLLIDCQQFIQSLPTELFCRPSLLLPGGTIGKHLRHLVDHYAAALVGHETDRVVDYDHRERNVPMENDTMCAVEYLTRLIAELADVSPASLDSTLTIRIMTSASGDTMLLASTLGRELAFATHHGVHHQAMMRAIACEHGHSVDCGFGKAPSTLNNENAAGPASR
jgi:hypothetical protein